MNKTDRMLAIVLELQRKGTLRAEDLAEVFETSVRTIYRDMQALSEAGVPLIGAPGQGYRLMEGYFLPPVSFTVEEAVTLMIGTDLVKQRFDHEYASHAEAARGKLEAILPSTVRDEVSRIRDGVKLLASGENRAEVAILGQFRRAIIEERKVSFRYVGKGQSLPGEGFRETRRTVAPYGLVLMNEAWIVLAYCELRQELRHFRLTRVQELVLTEERFQRPTEFQLQKYVPEDDRQVTVQLRIALHWEQRLRESSYYYIESLQPAEDGILVTLRVRRPEEVLSWILSFGADAVVLEPESLRARISDELKKMSHHY
jgi:predicted DNA-binding transcriptional regulator YafY